MGFIAPFIPFIASALGVGGTAATAIKAGSSILGGALSGGGGQSAAQKAATGGVSSLTDDLQKQSAQYGPFANKFMNMSQGAFPQAMNFWAPLLGGSRESGASVLSPQFSQIDEQNNALLQATKGSRTGAGASIYAAAPYNAAAQKQNMASTLRTEGASQMANLGSQTGQLGNQTLYSLISALSQAIGGKGKMLDQANIGYGQSKEAGGIFGNILNQAGKDLTGLFGEGGLFGGSSGSNSKLGAPPIFSTDLKNIEGNPLVTRDRASLPWQI
mgnify:CR=1 FL=1